MRLNLEPLKVIRILIIQYLRICWKKCALLKKNITWWFRSLTRKNSLPSVNYVEWSNNIFCSFAHVDMPHCTVVAYNRVWLVDCSVYWWLVHISKYTSILFVHTTAVRSLQWNSTFAHTWVLYFLLERSHFCLQRYELEYMGSPGDHLWKSPVQVTTSTGLDVADLLHMLLILFNITRLL